MDKINLELFSKNYWLIALVSGVIGVVSAFIPSWGGEEGGNLISVWYWGFYYLNGWHNLEEPPITATGVVVAIILLVGAALILYSALSAKMKDKPMILFSLVSGILFFIAPILFLITMAGLMEGFWLEYFAGIGLILPFIGGFLAILSWFSMKRK